MKLVETIINIEFILKESKHPDMNKLHIGMVFNMKTNKLEADQALNLPFK